MKKQAKTNQKIDDRQQAVIQDILDKELKKIERDGINTRCLSILQ